MTDKINLTTSMRTNLLSLQQISKLQDRTQLRLSTGLKVNSAIDNPSSYYTAQSLNNRADDLSALLDSMGQGIQTIKAASEGIETAEDLVTQMKAIAEQISTSGNYIPNKEYFIKEVGANGAVVSTANELRDAINSGKETICIYGQINLGDISTTGGLSLQENQKLVGVEYFGNFKDSEGFSSISATASVAKNLINIQETGCLISNLSLNYENSATTGSAYGININGTDVVADLQNLEILSKDGIISENKSTTNINNILELKTQGCGISFSGGAVINIESNANIDINSSGYLGYGIYGYGSDSTLNIYSGATVNILTSQQNTDGIRIREDSTINIYNDTLLNITTKGINAAGIMGFVKSNINIWGNVDINTSGGNGIAVNGTLNDVKIKSTASICFTSTTVAFYNQKGDGVSSNILEIALGAKLAFEKDGSTKWYEVKKDYRDENNSATTNNTISADDVETKLNVEQTEAWQTAGDIITEREAKEAEKQAQKEAQEAKEQANRETYQKQFNNALSQYDMLINDSAYKGINLLKEDTLKVNFNEDKSAHLLIQGVDMTSEGIGLLSAEWNTDKDVQTSLEQVLSAQKKLRSAATKLGNCYSIVSERQKFTENLINVLTEGADKLTLADMNEESANMLALQTQQQLAINSLSLASQASQGVLRLF